MDLSKEMREAYENKLGDKFYGLLKEREKNREWEKFLDSILIELFGFEENKQTINYLILVKKASMLRYLRYEYFRKTIFDCIDLTKRLS